MPVRILNIPRRDPNAESGSAFMRRIDTLMREQREEEIYKAVSSGNIPSFLRNSVTLRGSFSDSSGKIHDVILEAMPDYLAVGHDSDFCRIPMNPHTASKIAGTFGASLLTPKLSDFIYERASLKLTPFNYLPVGNANELPSKFAAHNSYIEEQIREAGGRHGELTAGIKKDVVLSERITDRPDRVAIYGWHKPGGIPIQPVYAGHVDWYVDYSHGIRFVNNQVLIDGKPCLLTEVLADPVLYKIFSDEERPIQKTIY
jgi:hypothetical protein